MRIQRVQPLDLIAGAIAVGAGTALYTGFALLHVMAASVLGALVVAYCLSKKARSTPQSDPPTERFFGWIVLLFFVPVLTKAVPPGADMAMHVALARSIRFGYESLSPAWGDVITATYPRGFSAWIAILSPVLGFAKSGLIVTAGTYALFTFGLRGYLRDVVGVPYPGLLAALCVLMAKSPQSFYAWGGNPTILAIALGLIAASLISRHTNQSVLRTGTVAFLLAFGAAAIHPIGAAVGALAIAASPVIACVRAQRLTADARRRIATCAMAGLGFFTVLVLLMVYGPQMSQNEIQWTRSWLLEHETVLPGSIWLFPVSIWSVLPQVLGKAYVIALILAALLQVGGRAGRLRCLGIAIAVVIVGGIMALGPQIPSIGAFLYPARFTPLLVVATAPLLGFAAHDLSRRAVRLSFWLVLIAFGIGFIRHVQGYQLRKPMATHTDVEVMRCLAVQVPADAVINGLYGDATQWIPALTGRAVMRPHSQPGLRDEIGQWQATLVPTYYFVGAFVAYGSLHDRSLIPEGEPVCASGDAALYKLGAIDQLHK